jgi:SH3-like domain-containing protein
MVHNGSTYKEAWLKLRPKVQWVKRFVRHERRAVLLIINSNWSAQLEVQHKSYRAREKEHQVINTTRQSITNSLSQCNADFRQITKLMTSMLKQMKPHWLN